MEKEIQLGWSEVEFAVDILVRRLPGVKWEAIYGVPRGGLVLASILAYRLDIPCVYTTLGIDKHHAKVYGERYLLVDDIYDTGLTHKKLRRRFPDATYATLYKKQRSEDWKIYETPDGKKFYEIFFGMPVTEGFYYKFPWAPRDEIQPGQTPI